MNYTNYHIINLFDIAFFFLLVLQHLPVNLFLSPDDRGLS